MFAFFILVNRAMQMFNSEMQHDWSKQNEISNQNYRYRYYNGEALQISNKKKWWYQ